MRERPGDIEPSPEQCGIRAGASRGPGIRTIGSVLAPGRQHVQTRLLNWTPPNQIVATLACPPPLLSRSSGPRNLRLCCDEGLASIRGYGVRTSPAPPWLKAMLWLAPRNESTCYARLHGTGRIREARLCMARIRHSAEQIIGKPRDDLLTGGVFTSLPETCVLIGRRRTHYNTARTHLSMGYRPDSTEGGSTSPPIPEKNRLFPNSGPARISPWLPTT